VGFVLKTGRDFPLLKRFLLVLALSLASFGCESILEIFGSRAMLELTVPAVPWCLQIRSQISRNEVLTDGNTDGTTRHRSVSLLNVPDSSSHPLAGRHRLAHRYALHRRTFGYAHVAAKPAPRAHTLVTVRSDQFDSNELNCAQMTHHVRDRRRKR